MRIQQLNHISCSSWSKFGSTWAQSEYVLSQALTGLGFTPLNQARLATLMRNKHSLFISLDVYNSILKYILDISGKYVTSHNHTVLGIKIRTDQISRKNGKKEY